jgi:type 1 glutamine amidotransferase
MKRLHSDYTVLIVSDEDEQMQTLQQSLSGIGEYTFYAVGQETCPHDLAEFDAVIMFVHSPLLAVVESALIHYAIEGGRLVILHHGIAYAKLKNPDWLDFLGVHINAREATSFPWRVVSHITPTIVNLRPGHFITTNGIEYRSQSSYLSSDSPSVAVELPAFELVDTEVFMNLHFTDGRAKTVLLGSKFQDPETGESCTQDRAGWIKSTGKGVAIYLQPGHSVADYKDDTYSRIIHNAIVWDAAETLLPPIRVPASTRRDFFSQDPFGWRDLMPDKDLSGWVEYGWPPGSETVAASDSSDWAIDDASGVLRTRGTPHTHILTASFFADFILHVEWRYLPGSGTLNSGVFVRMVPHQMVMHQIECLMGRVGIIMGGRVDDGLLIPISAAVPDGAGGWHRVPNHTSNGWWRGIGQVAEVSEPGIPQEYRPSETVQVNQPGEWNTYEILCIGRRITVWTNGVISSHTDNCTVMTGAIGFEAEGHPVEFRKIMIKVIAEIEPK